MLGIAYWVILFNRCVLNKKDNGKSATASAGANASNANPVLLLNNSFEKLYPAGRGGINCTMLSGNNKT